MDDLDKTLRDFIKKNHPLYDSGEFGDCIAEEQFADYLNNLLPPREKEQVESHLDHCNDCFQKSIMLSKVIDEMKNSDRDGFLPVSFLRGKVNCSDNRRTVLQRYSPRISLNHTGGGASL